MPGRLIPPPADFFVAEADLTCLDDFDVVAASRSESVFPRGSPIGARRRRGRVRPRTPGDGVAAALAPSPTVA